MNFTTRVFELQAQLGGMAVVENPRRSDFWRHPSFQRLVGSMAGFAEVHEHRPIQGRDTAWTDVYPTTFASAVVNAVDGMWDNPKAIHTQFPTDFVPAAEGGDAR